MRSKGYGTWSVCVSVCLSVYFNSRLWAGLWAVQRLKHTKGSKNNVADFAKMSVFELERETGTAGDDIAWPNPSISGVHMHMHSVEHAYIIRRSHFLLRLSFFREAVLAPFMISSQWKQVDTRFARNVVQQFISEEQCVDAGCYAFRVPRILHLSFDGD